MRAWSEALLAVLLVLLAGCGRQDATGPVDIRWDQDVCTRCAMAISDHHYAAEVRGAPAGQPTRVYKFDDIGCAVLWLDDQPWKDDPRTGIWVADSRSGDWLDARTARYVTGQITPMGYGLGARPAGAAGGLDFAQAQAHIREVEAREHARRGHRHSPAVEAAP